MRETQGSPLLRTMVEIGLNIFHTNDVQCAMTRPRIKFFSSSQ
jgi:hypothetical protein